MHLASSGRVIVRLSKIASAGQILCDEKNVKVAKVVELIGPVAKPYASAALLTNNIKKFVGKKVFALDNPPAKKNKEHKRKKKMETLEIQKCTTCNSSLIDDTQNGERICSGCGIVVVEQMEDYGPEARSNNMENRTNLARASGQATYSQHDLGITTEISIESKDFSGKKINSEIASQMHLSLIHI